MQVVFMAKELTMVVGTKKLSIIVPIFNEEENISAFISSLQEVLEQLSHPYEVIIVDDGSTDGGGELLRSLALQDERFKIVEFSRNFGKEIALTAGLRAASGDAAIMIDADLQHPPERIPEFIACWQRGAEVVVGVREKNHGAGFIKRIGSYLFYVIMNRIAETKLTAGATDYRLLDRRVIDAFCVLTERNRMTRGLIDWLGFKRDFIFFSAPSRAEGQARYSTLKLIKLALSSFISFSLFPLKFAGYLGLVITTVSGVLGLFMFVEKYVLDDPLNMHFSGSATLAVIILFLIGIVLSCLGLIALYIAHIHEEVINRPLYVIRRTVNLP
jgi:dolichol-phosphate mannosyltransferase